MSVCLLFRKRFNHVSCLKELTGLLYFPCPSLHDDLLHDEFAFELYGEHGFAAFENI